MSQPTSLPPIILVGPNHSIATKLRRQHELLLETLVQTRKQLMAYGIDPGEVRLQKDLVHTTPMTPPELPATLWNTHPTRTKNKARYEARKEILKERPSRERIIAAITRALTGSATTLTSAAVHRFVLSELQVTAAEISMQTISKYLGKNPHLFATKDSGLKGRCHWYLASNSFVAGTGGNVVMPNPYPMR